MGIFIDKIKWQYYLLLDDPLGIPESLGMVRHGLSKTFQAFEEQFPCILHQSTLVLHHHFWDPFFRQNLPYNMISNGKMAGLQPVISSECVNCPKASLSERPGHLYSLHPYST